MTAACEEITTLWRKPFVACCAAAAVTLGISSLLWMRLGVPPDERAMETVAVPSVEVGELEARLALAQARLSESERAGLLLRARNRELEAEVARLEAEVRSAADPASRGGGVDRLVTPETEAASAWLRGLQPDHFGDVTPDELLFLRELDLSDSDIVDEDLAHLIQMPSLVRLTLGGSGVSDDGLADLLGLERLRFLDLSHSEVTGRGLAALRDSSLESLHLSHSPISDEGLAHLPAGTRLAQLKLNHTRVTDAGLSALAALRSLKHLEIDNNEVGGEGLARLLEGNPAIERIEARGTGITDDEARTLRQAHPACEIVTDQGLFARPRF